MTNLVHAQSNIMSKFSCSQGTSGVNASASECILKIADQEKRIAKLEGDLASLASLAGIDIYICIYSPKNQQQVHNKSSSNYNNNNLTTLLSLQRKLYLFRYRSVVAFWKLLYLGQRCLPSRLFAQQRVYESHQYVQGHWNLHKPGNIW